MSGYERCLRCLAILLFFSMIAADEPKKKTPAPGSKPAAKPATKPAAKSPANTGAKPKTSKPALSKSAPSEKECAAFGQALVEAINQNDRPALQGLMDWDETLKRSTQVAEVPQKFRDQFCKEAKAGMQAGGDVLTKIAESVPTGARFSYHRCAREGSDRVAQFRRILADGGFDYFTFLLRKKPDGDVVAIDLKSLNMGDYFSVVLRQNFLAAAAAANRGLLARLSGADLEFVESVDELSTMNKLINEGKNVEVLAIYDKLPPKVQQMKSPQMLRVMAAQRSGNEKTYLTVMEDFLAKFPNDPSVDYLSIDFYFLRGKYGDAIQAIDKTAANVGGDAYLDILKSNVLVKKGDLPGARKVITAARENEPSLIDTHWKSIEVALAEKDFATVGELLDGVAERFQATFNDLEKIPEYAPFVASPEGKDWLKAHANTASKSAEPSSAEEP